MKGQSGMAAILMSGAAVAAVYAQAPSAKVAAVVNGEAISLAEVDAVLQGLPNQLTPPAPAQQRQLRTDALEMLIDDVLVRQFLAGQTPKVSPQDFAKEYEEFRGALQKKSMSLADYLRETRQTEEQLRREIVKKLQWERYLKQHAPETVLRKYYEENRDYYDHVTVQVSHILFRLPANAGEADRAQARTRLREVRQQIVAGTLGFAAAAHKYSQCQSADKGGDIGFIPRKWAVDERIAKAAFALSVGQISEVVETDIGLHLIKVTARKPGKPSTFEAVKAEVRQNYAMELMQDLIAKQRRTAKIESKMR